MEYGIQIGFFLCAYAVATHFTVRHCLEVQGFDQLIDRELIRKVGLVAEHQERDAFQGRFFQQ